MTISQIIVTFLFVPIIVSVVLTLMESGKGAAAKGVVHMPRFAWSSGLILSAITACICIAGLLTSLAEWAWIIAVAVGSLGVVFLLMYRSLQIKYDKKNFRVKRLFRAPKTYHYDEITGVTFGAGDQYTLHLKKGRIFVDNLAVGGTEFLYYAQVKWLECGLGDEFPEKKSRLFNGYLLNPMEFFITLLIVPVMFTGLLIWGVVTSESIADVLPFAIITAVVWLLFLAIYYICSHAPKYEKIMPFFVKRDYWNF